MLIIITQMVGLFFGLIILFGLFGILLTRKQPVVTKRKIYTVGAAGQSFHARTGYHI